MLKLIILMAAGIIGGCSGQLVCEYQSESELIEKIMHEVQHAQTQNVKPTG